MSHKDSAEPTPSVSGSSRVSGEGRDNKDLGLCRPRSYVVPTITNWTSKEVRDPDGESRWYELTSSEGESVRLLVHAPQHGFLDFAPIGGERVNVRVSPTRVVALSGSMSVDDSVVSGEVFVHLLSSEGGTDWLELKANGVRKGALANLVAALAKAPTVPLDASSWLWGYFCEENRRVQILEAERSATGDVTDEPTIASALTRLQGPRHWPTKCTLGTYSLPRFVGWSIKEFRANGDCVGYELDGTAGDRALIFTCLLNPAIYAIPKAEPEPKVLLSVGSRSAILAGKLKTTSPGTISGTLSIQLLPQDGGTERLLVKLFNLPRKRAAALLMQLFGAPLRPLEGINRDDTPWAYRYHECVLVERLRQAKLNIEMVSTAPDAIAALSSPPRPRP